MGKPEAVAGRAAATLSSCATREKDDATVAAELSSPTSPLRREWGAAGTARADNGRGGQKAVRHPQKGWEQEKQQESVGQEKECNDNGGVTSDSGAVGTRTAVRAQLRAVSLDNVLGSAA